MDINFNGYNENVLTFAIDDSIIKAGTPVKMHSNGTVTACTESDTMIGVAVNVRNGYAAVQLSGYIEVKTDVSEVPVGYNKLVCTADGKVAISDNGREYLVLSSNQGVAGIIL